MKFKSFLLEILETVFTSIIVLFIIYMWIAMPELVWGSSMEPNYYTGERILVEKVSKYFRDYERGDVVVLNPPSDNNTDYIKRVIGVPGDVVKIFECEVYILREGKKFMLDEPYLYSDSCTTDGPRLKDGRSIKIEKGQYLVLGDNRAVSADSRYFGLIEKDHILGRVIFRFWPLNKLGFQ